MTIEVVGDVQATEEWIGSEHEPPASEPERCWFADWMDHC
jgi:hypothetical protein